MNRPRRLAFVAPNHDVREPLPEMRTHGEWCRWLKIRGSLSEDHRRCMHADDCVASHHLSTEIEWRANRP